MSLSVVWILQLPFFSVGGGLRCACLSVLSGFSSCTFSLWWEGGDGACLPVLSGFSSWTSTGGRLRECTSVSVVLILQLQFFIARWRVQMVPGSLSRVHCLDEQRIK